MRGEYIAPTLGKVRVGDAPGYAEPPVRIELFQQPWSAG
jgi:hypothetical protein